MEIESNPSATAWHLPWEILRRFAKPLCHCVASPLGNFEAVCETPLPLRGISPRRGENSHTDLNLTYFQKFLPLPGEVPVGQRGFIIIAEIPIGVPMNRLFLSKYFF